MAVRTPFDSASDQPITAESLGWELRDAIPSLPLYSVSLHDDRAELLWLSEGEVDPDEQTLAIEAVQVLHDDRALPGCEYLLQDGRLAIFLAVRTHGGDLLGTALVLADPGEIEESVLEELITPQLRTILRKLAILMRPTPSPKHDLAEPAVTRAPQLPARRSVPERPGPESARWPALASEAPQAFDDPADLEPMDPPFEPRRSPGASRTRPAPTRSSDPLQMRSQPGAPPGRPTQPRPMAPRRAAPPAEPADFQTPARFPTLGEQPAAQSPAVRQSRPARAPRPAQSDAGLDTFTSAPVLAAAPGTPPAARSAGSRLAVPPARGIAPSPPSFASSTPNPRVFSDAPEDQSGLFRSLPDPVPAGLQLDVLPFLKLRHGLRTRRYEVLPRPSQRDADRGAVALDISALQQLAGWLGAHRSAWSLEPTSFTLNLSIDTLEDEQFLRGAASQLKTQSIAPDSLGFEIAEALCTQHRAQVERFIATCEQVGCFVAIDDFSFDSAILPLLRYRAVRLVRIDPRLIASAQRDKLSEALIVATIQATKVLGIHCAAKGVDSQASLQWLKTAGCDFAQGPALVQPQRLDSLG